MNNQKVKFTLNEILKLTQGQLLQGGSICEISEISTDSRSIKAGDLFIPLLGERFDGHQFIDQVIDKKASVVLLSNSFLKNSDKINDLLAHSRKKNVALIAVEGTLLALQKLAKEFRHRHQVKVLAVSGSVGKTTIKEMLAVILEKKFNILKSEKSFNGQIGLPLTLLRLQPKHQYLVAEMGINQPGEMQILCDLATPEAAILANIELVHAEFLGSLEDIAAQKWVLIENLPEGALTVLNYDCLLLQKYISKKECKKKKIVTFSLKDKNADFFANSIKLSPNSVSFEVRTKEASKNFKILMPGLHNVSNALAAIALSYNLGVSLDTAAEALMDISSLPLRLQILTGTNGIKLINDAYNASPVAMKAALEILWQNSSSKNATLILGDMRELGKFSQNTHQQIGHLIAQHKDQVRLLITVGKESVEIANGAISKGLPKEVIYNFEKTKELENNLAELLVKNDVILLKGSRAVGLEVLQDKIINIK